MVEDFEIFGMNGIANIMGTYLLSQEESSEPTDSTVNLSNYQAKLEKLQHLPVHRRNWDKSFHVPKEGRQETTGKIITKRQSSALCVQLFRPEKKNALTPKMYAELSRVIRVADADDSVRTIILHGIDGCFTSGNDLESFRHGPSPDGVYPHNLFIDALSHAQKPVIAAVSGIALGIGTIMLFHSDFVYATEKTRFSLPFVNLGLSPEGGTSYILPHLAGYHKAAELILLGKQFDSQFAEQIGLVNKIVPAEDLLDQALELAAQLAEKPPESLRAAKALLKRGMQDAVTTAMARELDLFNERLASPKVSAAIGRFFAK